MCQFGIFCICFCYFLCLFLGFLLSITINNTRVHTYQNVNNRKEGINKSFSNIYWGVLGYTIRFVRLCSCSRLLLLLFFCTKKKHTILRMYLLYISISVYFMYSCSISSNSWRVFSSSCCISFLYGQESLCFISLHLALSLSLTVVVVVHCG